MIGIWLVAQAKTLKNSKCRMTHFLIICLPVQSHGKNSFWRLHFNCRDKVEHFFQFDLNWNEIILLLLIFSNTNYIAKQKKMIFDCKKAVFFNIRSLFCFLNCETFQFFWLLFEICSKWQKFMILVIYESIWKYTKK